MAQCETEISEYKPFRIGGNPVDRHQCENAATKAVRQKSDGDTMNLCSPCMAIFKERNSGDEELYEFIEHPVTEE